MLIFVIGGPGSGKGTQCKMIVEKYHGGFRWHTSYVCYQMTSVNRSRRPFMHDIVSSRLEVKGNCAS